MTIKRFLSLSTPNSTFTSDFIPKAPKKNNSPISSSRIPSPIEVGSRTSISADLPALAENKDPNRIDHLLQAAVGFPRAKEFCEESPAACSSTYAKPKLLDLCQQLQKQLFEKGFTWQLVVHAKGISLIVENVEELVEQHTALFQIVEQLYAAGHQTARIYFEAPNLSGLYHHELTVEELQFRACHIDKIFDLEVQSVEHFANSMPLLREHPLIQLIFQQLSDYHSLRLQNKSLKRQVIALECLMENCLLAISNQPNMDKAIPLKTLYAQIRLKKQYLMSLKANISRLDTDVGVCGHAKLEAIDPMKRSWGVVSTLWNEVRRSLGKTKTSLNGIKTFFKKIEACNWGMQLQSLSSRLKSSSIIYLNESQRAAYALQSNHTYGSLSFVKDGKLYDTQQSRTAVTGSDYEIFAFKDGQLYVNRHEVGVFHHSSFFAGGAVDCAGEIRCHHGNLKSITLESGHYQPKRESVKSLLNWLGAQGADLTSLVVDTVEPIDYPVEMRQQTPLGTVPAIQFSLKTICITARYNAQELIAELNGQQSDPAYRFATAIPMTTVMHYVNNWLKAHDIQEGIVKLPTSFWFNLDQKQWIPEDYAEYEVREGTLEKTPKVRSTLAAASNQPSSSQQPEFKGSYADEDTDNPCTTSSQSSSSQQLEPIGSYVDVA